MRDTGPHGRRALLRLAFGAAGLGLLPAFAAKPDAFTRIEAAFAARLRGPRELSRALGMDRLRPGAATGAYYLQFLADAPSDLPFCALEMRLSRSRPAGIAVLSGRPGLPITPEAVRRRYGPANWEDVRPELPTFYLAYPRPGGSIAFGFPHGAGTLHSAVLNWGRWT